METVQPQTLGKGGPIGNTGTLVTKLVTKPGRGSWDGFRGVGDKSESHPKRPEALWMTLLCPLDDIRTELHTVRMEFGTSDFRHPDGVDDLRGAIG